MITNMRNLIIFFLKYLKLKNMDITRFAMKLSLLASKINFKNITLIWKQQASALKVWTSHE